MRGKVYENRVTFNPILLVPFAALAQIDWCEGNFEYDNNVDGSDVSKFKSHFGRSLTQRPCTNNDPCNGDFFCDGDVDESDIQIRLWKKWDSQATPCEFCAEMV